ncbi:MAG: hypothetical protein NZ529_08660 [Cytophagaceae bacterium]|nr:hypothetical protein [Cytophagaceae bacterium]MDW8456853.1 hypothetical protein [Cytophagaceae bacterium]
MKSLTSYRYVDGSGNTYNVFVGKDEPMYELEYVPIKPEHSSSGIYSGGDYLKKNITSAQFDMLSEKIKKAENNKKAHIADRVMMSGMVVIQKGNLERKFILNPSSSEKTELENLLKKIVNSE